MSKHVPDSPSFLRLGNIPLCINIVFCPTLDARVLLQFLSIVNYDALKIGVQVSV